MQRKEFSANKLYASEILAVLLQTSTENRKKFGEMGAIETLLMSISVR